MIKAVRQSMLRLMGCHCLTAVCLDIRPSISYVNIIVDIHPVPKRNDFFDSVSRSRPAAAYPQ